MNDCSTNANGPYDVVRLCIEFEGEEIPWMYPLALNGRVIKAMFADGEPVERVVRCRDCKMFDEHYLKCFRPVLYFDDDHKPHWTNETTFTAVTDATPDGYCAWGERRDGK